MSCKVRSDAFWTDWPEDKIRQLAAWCQARKSKGNPGGLENGRLQLAKDGVNVSYSAVRRFWAWFVVNGNVSICRDFASAMQSLAQKDNPDITPEALGAVGDAAFLAKAMAEQDAKSYVAIRKVDQAERTGKTKAGNERKKLEIAERRIALLEDKERRAQQAKEMLNQVAANGAKGGLTAETLKTIEEAAKLL